MTDSVRFILEYSTHHHTIPSSWHPLLFGCGYEDIFHIPPSHSIFPHFSPQLSLVQVICQHTFHVIESTALVLVLCLSTTTYPQQLPPYHLIPPVIASQPSILNPNQTTHRSLPQLTEPHGSDIFKSSISTSRCDLSHLLVILQCSTVYSQLAAEISPRLLNHLSSSKYGRLCELFHLFGVWISLPTLPPYHRIHRLARLHVVC